MTVDELQQIEPELYAGLLVAAGNDVSLAAKLWSIGDAGGATSTLARSRTFVRMLGDAHSISQLGLDDGAKAERLSAIIRDGMASSSVDRWLADAARSARKGGAS